MNTKQLYAPLLTCCLLCLAGRQSQAQPTGSDSLKNKQIGTLFQQLETADSFRIIVDQVVTRAIIGDYKRKDADSLKLKTCLGSLRKFAYYLDGLHKPITDSLEIEISDCDSTLKAYNTQIESFTFDASGNIGEQNFRDYQDARFRFIFAKSALIKAINSYQIQTYQRASLQIVQSRLRELDSLVRQRNAYRHIISALYINNSLFGLGYIRFLNDSLVALGIGVLAQANSSFNGLSGTPTRSGLGFNANVGLRFLNFLIMPGFILLNTARKTDNLQSPFLYSTKFNWNVGLYYHYKQLGLGFSYSPLYEAGICFSWWLSSTKTNR
ncbi:MAG TPA: hypothetical protein VNS58_08540 [Puia sp.]|nr:hypothetical protein [Puia sp.]